MTADGLRRLYENPATTVRSGTERAERQAAMLLEAIGGMSRTPFVVDVGCGDGASSAVAVAACARAGVPIHLVGFDWSHQAAAQASAAGVTVACGSTESPGLPLADRSIDVVIMGEVIEHLVDTDAALLEARRVLRPGGTLLVSTPNLAAWYNRALLALGVQPLFTEVSIRGIHGRPGNEVVGHLHVFTRRALLGLLGATGFVDVVLAGAPYHDVPRPLRPLDRLACRAPSLASILLASARAPG